MNCSMMGRYGRELWAQPARKVRLCGAIFGGKGCSSQYIGLTNVITAVTHRQLRRMIEYFDHNFF